MKSLQVTEVRILVLLQISMTYQNFLASIAPPQPQQQPIAVNSIVNNDVRQFE